VRKIFCLCGASGTGKSTILNHVREIYGKIKVEEVSARPFLPEDTDYVNSLTEQSQVLITQNRFVSFIEGMRSEKPVLFSRSPIDSLAYEIVLNKAPYIQNLLERQILATKDLIHYIYIPVEFAMEETDDIVRGSNDLVQDSTDATIMKTLEVFDIPYDELGGPKEERFNKLREIFSDYHIYGKES